jgi:hypothetical protein
MRAAAAVMSLKSRGYHHCLNDGVVVASVQSIAVSNTGMSPAAEIMTTK